MRRLITTLALVALAALAASRAGGIGFSGGRASVAIDDNATPPDTLDAAVWINPADKRVYFYHSWATLWLDGGVDLVASKTAADVTGALRWGVGTAHDTTTTSADGLWTADSLVITEIHFYGETNGGTDASVATTIWTNRLTEGPNLALTFDLDVAANSMAHDSTGMTLFTPDSCRIGIFVTAPSTKPDNPKVSLRAHKFMRP
ncbi:MAG: hypothetical protein GY838_13595 [bacterium]|nr:hypothetical protein [bacterium]